MPHTPIEIYIADDDPTQLQYYRSIIDKIQDFDCVGYTGDSDRILDDVEELGPQVVLLDYAMYPHNGFELTPKIRSTLPGIQVILVGGRNTLREAALDVGAAAYLSLPVTPKALIEAVYEVGRI